MKKLTAIGNIGYDAEIKEYNGSKFVSFTLAVNERYKDAQGNKVEKTDWINCTSYQTNIAQYLTKGKQIYVEGNPNVKPYQSRDGQWRASFNLHCHQIQLLQSGNKTVETDGRPSNNDNDNPPF